MKELKCPKCGSVFTVDEADYASIVSQVKNTEFNEELNRRLQELHRQHLAEQQSAEALLEKEHQVELNKKEQEALLAQIATIDPKSVKYCQSALAKGAEVPDSSKGKAPKVAVLKGKKLAEAVAALLASLVIT